ncbi:MAG: NAD(+) synthase [Clostridia bacterium]|nr:NAD(+) synthase [Clostridia bacterium]
MIHGFVKIASASPCLKVADCSYNKEQIALAVHRAADDGVKILSLPELCLSGATCGDLFFQKTLLDSCKEMLAELLAETAEDDVFYTVGFPYVHMGKLYNAVAAVYGGALLGVVPKTFIEGEERRYFTPAFDGVTMVFDLPGGCVNFGAKLVFSCLSMPEMRIGIEIGSDRIAPIPPSALLASASATVILNPSDTKEIVGQSEKRTLLAASMSLRQCSVYVITEASNKESTTDFVCSASHIIAQNGKILASAPAFGQGYATAVADLQRLFTEREKGGRFVSTPTDVLALDFDMPLSLTALSSVCKNPFVPGGEEQLKNRCREIIAIQTEGLKKRLSHIGCGAVLGISGGLDSTLALLITVKAFDELGWAHSGITCVTMPGFGTTSRTKNNAVTLCEELGVTLRTISITSAVKQHFEDIGHPMDKTDITYENSQARERTKILMDVANQTGGIGIGTGDLSELVLGWCTYNGDQMSMYGVNASVPKTLIRHLVRYFAIESDNEQVKKTLFDILDTPVSPELLPPDGHGQIAQKTEEAVGPYDLHDFFIYHALRHGFTPQKIYRLCLAAWADAYDEETIKKWLRTFYRRFFSQQFKRSCMPDGPSVGSVCLSPRGGLCMPSDACAALWVSEAENL